MDAPQLGDSPHVGGKTLIVTVIRAEQHEASVQGVEIESVFVVFRGAVTVCTSLRSLAEEAEVTAGWWEPFDALLN